MDEALLAREAIAEGTVVGVLGSLKPIGGAFS
jgi:hypothetical protein